jgi:hypothetical protein
MGVGGFTKVGLYQMFSKKKSKKLAGLVGRTHGYGRVDVGSNPVHCKYFF